MAVCADLGAVNEVVIPFHPLVPNPYTLLNLVPGSTQYFSGLDLKDTLFCILLCPDSQYHFAFEWRNPDTLKDIQYTQQYFCRVFGTASIFLEMH